MGHGADYGGGAGTISRVAKGDSPTNGTRVCTFGTVARSQRSETTVGRIGWTISHSHGGLPNSDSCNFRRPGRRRAGSCVDRKSGASGRFLRGLSNGPANCENEREIVRAGGTSRVAAVAT